MLGFLSEQINFDVVSYRTVLAAVALQVVIALVVPQVAGIAAGAARRAGQGAGSDLGGSLTESDPTHRGWLDRQILDPAPAARAARIAARC